MARQVAKFTKELGDSIQDTANVGGVGDAHAQGMHLYRTAMRNSEFLKKAAKVVGTAAATAVGGGLLGYGIKKGAEAAGDIP